MMALHDSCGRDRTCLNTQRGVQYATAKNGLQDYRDSVRDYHHTDSWLFHLHCTDKSCDLFWPLCCAHTGGCTDIYPWTTSNPVTGHPDLSSRKQSQQRGLHYSLPRHQWSFALGKRPLWHPFFAGITTTASTITKGVQAHGASVGEGGEPTRMSARLAPLASRQEHRRPFEVGQSLYLGRMGSYRVSVRALQQLLDESYLVGRKGLEVDPLLQLWYTCSKKGRSEWTHTIRRRRGQW
jgi:hypothetical protein